MKRNHRRAAAAMSDVAQNRVWHQLTSVARHGDAFVTYCISVDLTLSRIMHVVYSTKTRSHPEMVGDMSRVTVNFDLSKIPFVCF